MKDPVAADAAWVRARIALESGDFDAATAEGLTAWALARRRRGTRFGAAEVLGTAAIAQGWCFFHPDAGVAVLNRAIWAQHAGAPSMYVFCEQITDLREATWARFDLSVWQLLDDASRAAAGLEPSDWRSEPA